MEQTKIVYVRGGITPTIRAEILHEGALCTYCGAEASEIDHTIPVTQEGSSHPDNLRAICFWCNREKAAMTPEQWQEQRRERGQCWPPRSLNGDVPGGTAILGEVADYISMVYGNDLTVAEVQTSTRKIYKAFRRGADAPALAALWVKGYIK